MRMKSGLKTRYNSYSLGFRLADTHRLLRFGVFELNLGTEELRKSGTVLRLPPQPFQLLAFLASRAGQVVTREEIEEHLWSDESDLDFERRINQCIKQIRAVLADNPNQPVYIETMRLHGYRFIAPVVSKTVAAPSPKVTVSDSSAIEKDIAARVIARITESPSQIGQIVGAARARIATPSASQTAQPAHSHRVWWVVAVGAGVVIAILAALLYSHH
jgi:DNA-binding winged helix-turn-helix (wHTH) protein